jgi:Ni/Co efflux regulator RcnB
MKKLLGLCAAAAMTAAFALPAPAVAAEKRADGVRNVDQIEVSSRKRHRRHVHRYYAPRYGYRYRAYRPYYYDAPYYAYAPRHYYRPGVSVGVGPFGFGFGF